MSFGQPTGSRSVAMKEAREAEWAAFLLESKANDSVTLFNVCFHMLLFQSLCCIYL